MELSWGNSQPVQDWIKSQREGMERWQAQLLDAVKDSHWRLAIEDKNKNKAFRLDMRWNGSPVAETLKDTLLDKLTYSEISDREKRIPLAFQQTYEWIFSDPQTSQSANEPWSSFKQWLEHGTGIYWITGKPGSGKSTLMKMIIQDPRTKSCLEQWSGQTPLVMAGFYFWNSGTELQTSQTGLLRCLLHQALTQRFQSSQPWSASKWSAFSLSIGRKAQNPSTIGSSSSLSWDELVQCFRFLVEDSTEAPVSYVFFIDGLDEYSGESTKLLSLVNRLSSFENVKICVSSRPWVVFEDAYNQRPNLMLQHRTAPDIAIYAKETLSANTAFRELQQFNAEYASTLIENITSKASGVFLWVVLVVRSLVEGLEQGDKPTELQARLEKLPEELDDLFKKILHGLKGERFSNAAQVFRVFEASVAKPSVLMLSFADDEDDESLVRREVVPLEPKEIWYRSITMKRRLNSRCKGLLEVGPLPKQLSETYIWTGRTSDGSEVEYSLPRRDNPDTQAIQGLSIEEGHLLAATEIDYLHRTVRDFLLAPKIWAQILTASGESFNPHLALFRAQLMFLKTIPLESLSFHTLWKFINGCLEQADDIQDMSTYIRYLDAMNEAAIHLTSQKDARGTTYIQKYWSTADRHWASTSSLGETTDTFLTFAVRCNLVRYVQAKFNESPPSVPLATALLRTAFERQGIPFLIAIQSQGTTGVDTQEAMIDLLVQHGARHSVYGKQAKKAIQDRYIPTENAAELSSLGPIGPGLFVVNERELRSLRSVRMTDWLKERIKREHK